MNPSDRAVMSMRETQYAIFELNSYPAIRSVGQNPKKNKIKKPVDLTSAYLAF